VILAKLFPEPVLAGKQTDLLRLLSVPDGRISMENFRDGTQEVLTGPNDNRNSPGKGTTNVGIDC